MKTVLLIFIASCVFLTGCGDSDTSTNQAVDDVIDDAYRVCAAMNDTGLASECEVKGWGRTVDVRIDTTGLEARKICNGVVEVMSEITRNFKGEWKLQIFSPYSGDRPLAVCILK